MYLETEQRENDRNREMIAEYAKQYPNACIGNLHKNVYTKLSDRLAKDPMIYNFEFDFVTPERDPEVIDLLKENARINNGTEEWTGHKQASIITDLYDVALQKTDERIFNWV